MNGLSRYAKADSNFWADRDELEIPSQVVHHETVPLVPRIEANGLPQQAGADTYPNPTTCSGKLIASFIGLGNGVLPLGLYR